MAAVGSLRADGPLRLIPTPFSKTGKTDQFTDCASHMALVHNMMLHAFNSIHRQALAVKPQDVPDFIQYCRAWYETVAGHHESEEAVLFPMIEEATGAKGVMDEDLEEHKAFYGGLEQLKQRIDEWALDASDFSGAELVKVLDSFGTVMETHLHHEPTKLTELSRYQIDMKAISDKTAKYSVDKTSTTDVLPMMWYNLDKDFEDGRWASFPELPAPVKWVMINILGWWRSRWWRFGSSGPDGVQRDLYCLRPDY